MIDAGELARILAEQGFAGGGDAVVVVVYGRDEAGHMHARLAAKNAAPLQIEGAAAACLIALQQAEVSGRAARAQQIRVESALEALADLGAAALAPPTVIPSKPAEKVH